MTRRRRLLLLALLALSLATAVAACTLLTPVMVSRTDAAAPRNPETGLLVGAEPVDLGPEDSECAILLVHGHLGAPSNFAELPALLAERGWRVRVMLLPGHGTSPFDYDQVTAGDLQDAVRRELRSLAAGRRTVVVGGHSMGGALAAIAASEEDVDGLVLIAPYFGVSHHWWYGLRPETWTRLGTPFLHWLYKGRLFTQVNRREAAPLVVSYRWVPMSSVVGMQEIALRARGADRLSGIRCPVFWAHSPNDVAASFEEAHRTVDAMVAAPRRECLAVPASNHHLLLDYDRGIVGTRTVEFLESLKAGPGALSPPRAAPSPGASNPTPSG